MSQVEIDTRGASADATRGTVRSPTELAQELAQRARSLRRLALQQLAEDKSGGWLRRLYVAFKAALIHQQTEAEFADAFAQTLTYGLLTARWLGNEQRRSAGERFTRQTALPQLPATSAFLNELFCAALRVKHDEQPEKLRVLVDDIVALLDQTDVAYVFGAGDTKSDPATDPVIHFYEPFLAAYDKALKNKRGVFFTPRPVVSHIVRGVHERLQSEFGLEDGLASTDTWAMVAQRIKTLQLPVSIKPDDPFVRILDPATGTGTFLFECIELIEHVMKQRWCREFGVPTASDPRVVAKWTQYVPRHLLPRLYGYELMMASYAVAHLKLAFKLSETGYLLQAGDRLNIYLTNSLDPPSPDATSPAAGLRAALGQEAQVVAELKRTSRFTVVIGNPPYAKLSANLTAAMRATVKRYRFVDGERIRERGALQFEINLQDDYVKFVRLCENTIEATGVGLLGLITSHGYLRNPTLRGMRNSLLSTFSRIWILDLHGHLAKGEVGPAGQPEENVFDIAQGVAIFLGSRRQLRANRADAQVFHADCYGRREEKYDFLRKSSLQTLTARIHPSAPFYLLVPHAADREQEWRTYCGLGELFRRHSAGIITARDRLVLAENKRELAKRLAQFSQSTKPAPAIYAEYGFSPSKRFSLRDAQRELRQLKSFAAPIIRILYRPFDERYIFFHPSVVWSMSRPMAEQLRDGKTLALVATRQVTRPQFEHVFVSRHIIEIKACSHDRNTQIFPLFVGNSDDTRESSGNLVANLQATTLAQLAAAAGISGDAKVRRDTEADFARRVLHYIYAVLHAPEYRKRYFEFLRSDFPRIPLTPSPALFKELAELGGELVTLHLLESPKSVLSRYRGVAKPEVEKPSYSANTIWLNKENTAGFQGVSAEVWNFRVGGYPVCEKWLKDRKGRCLTRSEIDRYERIIFALQETLRLMTDIDAAIERHGGWPGAFDLGRSGSSP